jgi:Calcium-activated chloride channel
VGVSIHVIAVGVMQSSIYGALETVYSVPIFCVLVAVWTTCYLQSWRNKEIKMAFKWGMEGYEESEVER